jgi:hypothetical protein
MEEDRGGRGNGSDGKKQKKRTEEKNRKRSCG